MRFVGVEKTESSFFLAQVRKKKNHFEIEKLESWSTSEVNVKRLYRKFFKRTPFASGLDQVLHTSLYLPNLSPKEGEKTLGFQIESTFFLKPKSYLYAPLFSSHKKGEINLFITSKSSIKNHLFSWEKYNLEPEKISFHSLALVHYTRSLFPSISESYILHLGQDRITLVWMKKNLPFHCFSLDWGENQMREFFKKKGEEEKKRDIRRCFCSLKTEKKLPLFFTGNTKAFKSWFFEICSEYVENFLEAEEKNEPTLPYAIAIGLAMSSLSKETASIQFRKNEWVSSSFLKKIGFYAFFLLSFFWGLGLVFWGEQKKELRKEKEILEKRFQAAYSEESIPFEKKALEGSLREKIESWEQQIEKEDFYKKIGISSPTVSSFLHWLSHNPLLQSQEIEIDKIEYRLEKYPFLQKPQDPYQVFIKLRLKIASAVLWHAFLESLSQNNPLVDQKKDFTWKQEKNFYEVSFSLKKGALQ